MDSFFNSFTESSNSPGAMFENLKQTADLPPRVVSHLRDVYSFLAVLLATATAACYLSVARIFTLSPVLLFLGSLAVMFGFAWGKTESQKRNLALLFAFLQGTGIGPIVQMAGFVGGERLIFQALGATAAIFVGFTGATLLSGADASASRWKVYAFGLLASLASAASYLALFNLFFGWGATYTVELYLGLAVFCLYIIADTQMIVAKALSGQRDVVKDSMALFVDLVQVFVRILVVLMRKQQDDERREREKRRRR